MNKELIGFDNHGQVFELPDSIFRKIQEEYKPEVNRLYQIYKSEKLDNLGIVETSLLDDGDLEHKKFVISYPFEWTANMYKDAVLFHINLFLTLDKYGLTLKDALPNNIVFNFIKPVFVDFISMVEKEKLTDEAWLVKDSNYTDARFVVFDRMFVPYMLIPLLAMWKKNYALARKLLSENACNCGAGVPHWGHLTGSGLPRIKSYVKNRIKSIIFNKEPDPVGQARRLLKSRNRLDFMAFNKRLLEFVEGSDVAPPMSGYVTYYRDKKEAFNFENQTGWNGKQKNIYELIIASRPKRVLDIGANTGWFSILAAKLGSEVIATDIDESSIDLLYIEAKKEALKILPLLLSFDDLEKKIFGLSCDEKEYEGRDFENTPLFMPATERISSDVVLCLGLIHHLVLGMGKEIDGVMRVLSKLAKRTLVLEFIALKDRLVQGEPTFFKKLNMYSEINYNMDIVMAAGLRHFKSLRVADSEPETRKLLIFDTV